MPLRILCVEECETEAQTVRRELERELGFFHWRRVGTAVDFLAALDEPWDVVLSGHELPSLTACDATRIMKDRRLDVPCIVVSGPAGEDHAVAAMRAGACDYLTKQSLSRLVPVVLREVREARIRRERREARVALAEAEQHLRLVLQSTQDRVFTLDRELRVTAVHGAWLGAEGVSASAFIGKTPRELYGSAGALHEAHGRRALLGTNQIFEWTLERPGGARHFQTSLSPIRDVGGAVLGAVGISRDITELRRMQEQLVISDRMASVGTLAAGVAHEINNPLACVLVNVEIAAQDAAALGAPADELREALADAHAAAKRVRDLVQDLRIFSRHDDGERLGPVDVAAVLDSSVRLAWNDIRHRARVVRSFEQVPPARANASRLGQVFLNLLVNAAQAIPEGAADRNEIALATRLAPDGRIAVEVRDTGCGMDKTVLSRLFTPFFTTKPPALGTGLGLSICHRILTELGGDIDVASAPGAGTRFTIHLPPDDSADAEQPSLRAPPSLAAARADDAAARHARVLVIDDEEGVRRAIARALRGHDVTGATGAEALELFRLGRRYDLVLCDVMMPVLTGLEVHAEILRIAPEQAERMAFMTGGAFTEDAQAFLASGKRLLEKPLDLDLLRRLADEVATH